MPILAVFARPNHPEGYGFCQGSDVAGRHPLAKAHGYIIVVVQCENQEQLRDVRDRLASFHHNVQRDLMLGYDPWKRGDSWYAGPYELVWSTECSPADSKSMHNQPFPVGSLQSYGDNRACAYLTAAEVLEE